MMPVEQYTHDHEKLARYPKIDQKEMDRANRSAAIYGAGYLVLTNGRWQSFSAEEVKIIRKTNDQSEITALRAQLAKSEKTKMALAGDKIDLRQELAEVKGKLAAAEADKLAFGERVREAVLAELIANMVWMPKSRRTQAKADIRALDLDALAEGEK